MITKTIKLERLQNFGYESLFCHYEKLVPQLIQNKSMSNLNRVIQDSFCNGFTGQEYDMGGALIITEGENWIVCQQENGETVFIDFQIFDWIVCSS